MLGKLFSLIPEMLEFLSIYQCIIVFIIFFFLHLLEWAFKSCRDTRDLLYFLNEILLRYQSSCFFSEEVSVSALAGMQHGYKAGMRFSVVFNSEPEFL